MSDAGEPAPNAAFLSDVLEGLSQRQKAVPARWLYDRRGSELFEDITRLPEYYPTRTETSILRRHGPAMGDQVRQRAVVEFGSGSSEKTPLLLADADPLAYVPIDISGEFLRQSAERLAARFPRCPVIPVEADFTQPVALPEEIEAMPRLGFFPGSTIGNMVARTAVDLLRSMRATLGDGSQLLIGFDLLKPTDMLLPAYDDAAGVTAAFNLNLLGRINRELGADIPEDAFAHRARWNADIGRIEMHLEALRPVGFSIAGRRFAMAQGETIHSENSHKYAPGEARLLLRAGGWTPVADWGDDKGWFTLILCDATEYRMAP